jgi:hypothetical protein
VSAARTVEIGWEHPDTDEAFRIRCSVIPGTPDRGPDFGCSGGYPGDPPDVEVLDVVEDRPGGQSRPDLVPVVEERFVFLHDHAFEMLDDGAPHDTREEARGEV